MSTTGPDPAAPLADDDAPPGRAAGFTALGGLYLIYGTTYLGMRVAVAEGSGFPPFIMGASRLLGAGLLMLAILAVVRRRVLYPWRDLAAVAAPGIVLWTMANGSLLYALQRADSGFSALMFGAIPIWTAVIESLAERRRPSALLVASVLVGFAGLAVLNGERMGNPAETMLPADFAVLLSAPLLWSLGSVWNARRRSRGVRPFAVAGWQMVAGGAGLAIASLLFREPAPNPTTEAWLGFAYLLFVGALVGYSCYTTAIRALPVQVTMTYPYVNPVIAVLVGWVVLSEPITGTMGVGGSLLITGVIGVFHDRYGLPFPGLRRPGG